MTETQTPAERRDEVIRTCELAVTRLENGEQGWVQGEYANGVRLTVDRQGKRVAADYSRASACLGGALVISQREGNVVYGQIPLIMDADGLCPAVTEVAETIRALPVERRRFVRLQTRRGIPFTDAEVIVSFNDHEGRTRDEVVDVVNDTIKRMIDENVAEAG